MHLTKTLRFIFEFITLGLAIAFIILMVNPALLGKAGQQNHAGQNKVTGRLVYSYAAAVKAAAPAVVSIYTVKTNSAPGSKAHSRRSHGFMPNQQLPGFNQPGFLRKKYNVRSLGSGVIIDASGLILTNHHVVRGATAIRIMLADGRTAKASIVGTDPDTDLAVLRIKLKKLPVIRFGNSKHLRVGDVVLAIGNPYDVGQTVTQGIVSAKGRKYLGLNTYENFIQTDAAINPGNSGGALINARGQLIGISTAIYSRSGGSQGIGFAIPINLAKSVTQSIVKHGVVIRGWLGIVPNDLGPQQAARYGLLNLYGVLVVKLYRNSPAHLGGIMPGDVITGVNMKPVINTRHLLDVVARQKPGSSIKIQGVRNKRPFTARIIVGRRPKQTRSQ